MNENQNLNVDYKEKMKIELKSFFDKLSPKLEENGFNEEQQKKIELQIIETQKEIIEKRPKSTTTNQKPVIINQPNENWEKIMAHVAENPDKIINLFKAKWWKVAYDFGIALIVVAALVILALMGHLEATHTATLFGGIIGYLLGSSR